mgnify:CR=1 FL=1
MQMLQTIPGIGPLTATALAATATDIHGFHSGRQFAAWLGLTPRQTGTGGKIRQPGISKRGDSVVRTLFVTRDQATLAHFRVVPALLVRDGSFVRPVSSGGHLSSVSSKFVREGPGLRCLGLGSGWVGGTTPGLSSLSPEIGFSTCVRRNPTIPR